MGIDNNTNGGLIDTSNTTNSISNIQQETEKMQEDSHLDRHNHQNDENSTGVQNEIFCKKFLFNKENQVSEIPTVVVTKTDTMDDANIVLANPQATTVTQASSMKELLHKLTESSSILSSSSSSSCVNSSGIGSTDLSPHHQHDYDLSRSPSSDTFIASRKKREGSVASQVSTHSCSLTDNKDGLGFLLAPNCNSPTKKTSSQSSRKEVIPQRKRRDFIPNELKDESYWERRRKNNLAAKRSREKRRLNDIVLEAKVLELTNINNVMKLKFDLCMKKYNINEDEVDKMFEENKHLLVVQETLDMSELLTNEDSLNQAFDNDSEHFATLSSSSSSASTSGKRIKSLDHHPHLDGLRLIHDVSSNNMTHSSLHNHHNSCSISTNSSQHIDSSGRSNSSSVDDDVYNEAISENELEIDENLGTNAENDVKVAASTENNNNIHHEEEDVAEDSDDQDLESNSPPSKRKNNDKFFNPTHTSSCPSKSPSPTLIQSTQSLSPIDSYQTHLKLQNQISSEKLLGVKAIKNEPDQMKSQYPLLYNQLCKQQNTTNINQSSLSSSSVKQQQNVLPSLEQQNQMLLNKILSQSANGSNINENPLIKGLLTELLNRSTNSSPPSVNITEAVFGSSLPTQTRHSNDILTKILSSNLPAASSQTTNTLVERLGALLKPANSQQHQQAKPAKINTNNSNNNTHASALMEKYKNLINKTNGQNNCSKNQNSNSQQQQQHSLKSAQGKLNYQPPSNTQSTPASKNTVNSLLQTYSAISQEVTTKPKSASSSRKRHLNQQQNQANETTHDVKPLLTSNPDLLAYANNNRNGLNKNGNDLNEMVAMMLAAQQQNNFNRQTSMTNHHQQQKNQQFNSNITSAKNSSNLAKNQTYNQLLMMHQTQKLQQRQQQHEAALLSQRQSLQHAYMNSEDLVSTHSSVDNQGIDSQALQQLYQQQQLVAAASAVNGQNSNNGANDNNMPLKLRFKMLQLKTGEVN